MSIIEKVLNKTTELRKKHEKRNDPRRFLNVYEGLISLPAESACYRISLGYLERFLIMAQHNKVDNNAEKGVLKIDMWDEGCGLFSGKYSIQTETEKIKSGTFEWSGSGQIENSWNNFSKFE